MLSVVQILFQRIYFGPRNGLSLEILQVRCQITFLDFLPVNYQVDTRGGSKADGGIVGGFLG